MSDSVDLTGLIHRAQAGDLGAADALFAATYPALRRLARARLSRGGRSALVDTTSLVHEWYVRFASGSGVRLADRTHYLRYASRTMRAVIIDFTRRRVAARRGGGAPHLPLTVGEAEPAVGGEEEILRVHEALGELATLDQRMADVVELRYFGGLTEREIAEALGVTDRTVRRDWEKARLWLAEALR
jgi:RNA polymerase sigma factor (TIGR02999 family)